MFEQKKRSFRTSLTFLKFFDYFSNENRSFWPFLIETDHLTPYFIVWDFRVLGSESEMHVIWVIR